MRRSFTFLIFVLLGWPLCGQISWGLKGGVSSTELAADVLAIPQNNAERFRIDVEDVEFGIHGGLVLQARINRFLIQPELLLNSQKVNYQIEDLANNIDTLLSEKYQYLDVPLLFGYQLGPLRLMAGPEAHFYLNSTAFDLEGYEQNFDSATFSWLAGIGLDFWSLMLDVRYEGNFSEFGDHLTFFDQSFSFNRAPARLLVSLTILFNKKR